MERSLPCERGAALGQGGQTVGLPSWVSIHQGDGPEQLDLALELAQGMDYELQRCVPADTFQWSVLHQELVYNTAVDALLKTGGHMADNSS